MFLIDSYPLAVVFCFITMLCWGSWANTMKLVSDKRWTFPLFYWDYSLGVVILALAMGLTLGSWGEDGRGFTQDLQQVDSDSMISTFVGGVIFNLANLLLVAAIAIAGIAVAFPLAIGLALVIGVVVNYSEEATGSPLLLMIGVALIVVAMVANAIAYTRIPGNKTSSSAKGFILTILSGVIMGFFYRFVADGMTMNFVTPEAGKMTPYSAVFVFSIGIFISNFVWNLILMYRPIEGEKVSFGDYFKRGSVKVHLVGILGGMIWNAGMLFSLIASEKAGTAISYGLGQGATMIAAFWGVVIWKEFKTAPKSVNPLLVGMFVCFIGGLSLIVFAKN